jgi:RNA polymerase-interacting CarD/CdnL/TRCF family regulator
MTITVGQKVYYAGRGPYLVAGLVSKMVCGISGKFYRFVLLGEADEEFLLPIGSAALLPLRSLTAANKIPELLERLKVRVGPSQYLRTWRERDLMASKVFASGSAFELSDLLESLTRSSNTRKLAADEWEALRRARKLLISEIAEVMGESPSAAESRIDAVLNPERNVIKKTARKLIFSRRPETRR